MDITKEMFNSMYELSVISKFLRDKLISQYDSSEKGRRFVKAVLKGWTRDSYFIREYEKRLLNEWKKLKEYYRDLKRKARDKKAQRIENPPEPDLKVDLDKCKKFPRKVHLVCIADNDRQRLLEIINESNVVFDYKMFRTNKCSTFFEVGWTDYVSHMRDRFDSKCKDLKYKRDYYKYADMCFDSINNMVHRHTHEYSGFNCEFHKIYFITPLEI